MRRLYLLRHGIAVPHGTDGFADDERPLTPRGERRLRQLGRALRRVTLRVDQILASPLPRAWRTAAIVGRAIGLDDQVVADDALRPDAPAASIRDHLDGDLGDRDLMIVGHNPSLSDLLALLTGGRPDPPAIELRKGAIAALVGSGHDYRLDWLVRPGLVRRLGGGG